MKQIKILPILAMLVLALATGCKTEEEIGKSSSVVLTTNPNPDASEIPVNGLKISATFSVPMNPSTITNSTFVVKQGGAPIDGDVKYADKTATFIPSSEVLPHVLITSTITKGARDIHGKAFATDYSWSFTTCHPPEVESVNPANQAICVALNQPIAALFNDETDGSTLTISTFTLVTGSTSVAGTVTFSDGIGTFTPTASLLESTIYTATITTGLLNSMGMPLENAYVWSFTTTGPLCEQTECPPTIDLKTAGGFGILAGVGITNVGLSVINDFDVGISPGFRSSITGFPPGVIINGVIRAADDIAPPGAIVTQAKQDLTDAYLVAQNSTSPSPVTIVADLGGLTLVPGIYKSASSMHLQSGNLILDGGQSPCDTSSVWIFQIGSTLTTVGGGGGNVILINGAKANRVFWQVGSSATIGDGTSFKGNILALTSITLGSSSTVEGRALARNGAVTLAGANTIDKP